MFVCGYYAFIFLWQGEVGPKGDEGDKVELVFRYGPNVVYIR